MKKNTILYILLVLGLAIIVVAVFTNIAQQTTQKVIQEPDSDLVKCIEQKFTNGELEPTSRNRLITWEIVWVVDSLEVVIIEGDERHETYASVWLGDDYITLTERERERIVEIVETYQDIEIERRELAEDKKQLKLREQLTQFCK